MTLKEELEILRGEPIAEFDGDPMNIPCIETSDPEKLCKHPVVSVHMITYNHEPYIRQAIEGVMMQKTDFEFELVIGEDASQDKTREICFEYQKKYPDKIRVLWWHENVSKFGGNGRRVTARCRGEFIAFCEGDDYWIDPLKLQKQVDVMRRYPNVGYCMTGARVLIELPPDHPRAQWFRTLELGRDGTYRFPMEPYRPGVVPQDEFWRNRNIYPRTATVLYRRSFYSALQNQFEIFKWKLRVGDLLLWHGFARICDAYFLDDETAVYRLNSTGVCSHGKLVNYGVQIDGNVERVYFLRGANENEKSIEAIYKLIVGYRMDQVVNASGPYTFRVLSQFLDLRHVVKSRRIYWVLFIVVNYLRRIKRDVSFRLRNVGIAKNVKT